MNLKSPITKETCNTTDERLSDLGVLSIESRRAKALDLDVFVDRFSRQHNRRILLL